MLHINYYYCLSVLFVVSIAGVTGLDEDTIQPGSVYAESEIYPTDHSTEDEDYEHPGFKKAEGLLELDPDEEIGEKKPKDDSNNSLIWIIIVVVLLAFIFLGIFNHIIIPMFCMDKPVQKEDKKEEVILKMSDIEKDIEEKKEKENNRGSINEGFEDIPLKTDNIETERVLSIENENFEKTVLKAVSAISPEMKEKFDTNNYEYTQTPRNSMYDSNAAKDNMDTVAPASATHKDVGENSKEHVMSDPEDKDTVGANRSDNEEEEKYHNGQENDDTKKHSRKVEGDLDPLNNNEGEMLAIIPDLSEETAKGDSDMNQEGKSPTDPVMDINEEENDGKEKIDSVKIPEIETEASKKEASPTEKDSKDTTSVSGKDMKEQFRSRKKSMMSIEIEDGNITNFVEGPAVAKISAIPE